MLEFMPHYDRKFSALWGLLGTSPLFLPKALRVGHETRKDNLYQCKPGRFLLLRGQATIQIPSYF